MRVGLDARKLRDGGIGTYIRELIGVLPALPDPPALVAFADPGDREALAASHPGCEVVAVRAGRYSLAEHVVLPAAARRAGVDLFHAPHYTLPLLWRGPAVVTVHDLIHIRWARLMRPGVALYARAVAGAAVRRAAITLVDSEHTRGEVVELLGASPERVRVAPLGVSPTLHPRAEAEVEAFRRARDLPAGYLLYVGARKPHKNLGLLIEVLAPGLRRGLPPLVLSGVAWRADDPLARAAARAGVANAVYFSGPIDGSEDLARLYSGAALYLQPSLTEGFGLPPLEAMACGVPVLASTGGALPETLGTAAVLLPPRDPDAWAAEAAALLADRGRRATMVERGVAHARGYTWERTARLTLEAYREALTGRSRR